MELLKTNYQQGVDNLGKHLRSLAQAAADITPAKGGKETRKSFTFNRDFNPQSTQDTQPLIHSVLDGYNVCISAYGQTGSVKTFMMTGPEGLTPELMGVNYRALNDLFDFQQYRKNMIAYEVHVQMLEICKNKSKDLLITDGSVTKYPLL
nr:kinesin-like protein KIN-14G [Tanacetum cinerariifolium]